MNGREEHHSLRIDHFRPETDKNGRRYISYTSYIYHIHRLEIQD